MVLSKKYQSQVSFQTESITDSQQTVSKKWLKVADSSVSFDVFA